PGRSFPKTLILPRTSMRLFRATTNAFGLRPVDIDDRTEEKGMPGNHCELALSANGFGLDGSADQAMGPLEQLVELAKGGDAAAFDEIMRRNQRRVLSTAWSMLGNEHDAWDASQEVFLRVYRYLRSFKPGQDFEAWLYRIIINTCHDVARKRANKATV